MKLKKQIRPFAKYLAKRLDLTLVYTEASESGEDKCTMEFSGNEGFRLKVSCKVVGEQEVIRVNYLTEQYTHTTGIVTKVAEENVYYMNDEFFYPVEKKIDHLEMMYPHICSVMGIGKKNPGMWAIEYDTVLLDMGGFPKSTSPFTRVTRQEFLRYASGSRIRMSEKLARGFEEMSV